MDGKELLYGLRQLLEEDSTSGFMDDKTSYSYLYEAAVTFVQRTGVLKSSQSITTVADQTDYTLNADFITLYLKNQQNKFYLKYNDGSNNHFITARDYEDIIYSDNTTSVSIPSNFAILDDATLDSQVTGTATSAGAATGGQCTLTDTAGDFSDVSAGDVVHNTTDGSDGFVLSKTSSTALVTALFGGTNDDWSSSDAYVIQPQGRLKLVLDPPPSTANHTITVQYIQRPPPVYSSYGVYRFQQQYNAANMKYAAWLYKYRDGEPNFGDAWYQYWDLQVKLAGNQSNKAFNRKRINVNLKVR